MNRKETSIWWLFVLVISLVAARTGSAAKALTEEQERDRANQAFMDCARTGQKRDNKPERLEWLQDSGFGLSVHWGLDSQLGSVESHSMVGASDDYLERFINELPKTFNPKRFDAEELAVLAKLAGARYILIDTKHHSGFCMWDTKTTDFNIMNTPYGKDIVAQLAAAARKHGLAVGLYYSPEDFHYLYKRGIQIRRREPLIDADTDPGYAELIRAQCRELMTKYGRIDVVCIDGLGKEPAKEIIWGLQPDTLITRGALDTPEQTLAGIPPEGAWEARITMGTQWQYKPTNENYKSGTRIIEILIETRARGGALLLTVGPKPDGTLPKEQEELLREIALWHFVNGEAIHNVRGWIITNEDNIWFTKKKDEDTLYAFITKIPDWERGTRKDFVLKSVKATEGTKFDVLGQSSRWIEYRTQWDPNSRWTQREDGLHVSVARAQRLYNDSKWPNPIVLRLTNVRPALVPPKVETLDEVNITDDGVVTLKGRVIDMAGTETLKVGFQYRPYAGFVEELYDDTWFETELLEVKQIGDFQIDLKGLKERQQYQYRAIVTHPKITMYGNINKFSVP
jgi:alpha-L-fucosidase